VSSENWNLPESHYSIQWSRTDKYSILQPKFHDIVGGKYFPAIAFRSIEKVLEKPVFMITVLYGNKSCMAG